VIEVRDTRDVVETRYARRPLLVLMRRCCHVLPWSDCVILQGETGLPLVGHSPNYID